MSLPTVILLLKAPRPNEVKTRLAASVGPAIAVSIYRQMVDKLRGVFPPDWPVQIHYSPADAELEMKRWLADHRRPRLTFQAQADGDLGDRLATAFTLAFSNGATQVFALGGDCPALTSPLLESAHALLSTHDAVLGPADDGGYYLLGLRSAQPSLFTDIRWGTSSVLPVTRRRLAELKLRTAELPTLSDVDDHASWRRAVAAGWLENTPVNNR